MKSKKTLEQALYELEGYMYFDCKARMYDCEGDCNKCRDYAVSKEDFRDTCRRIREKYESK